MLNYVKLYLLTAVVFFALDFAWITFGANPLYQRFIPHLLAPKPNFVVAFGFYLVYLACVLAIAVVPTSRGTGDVWQAVSLGALLGLAAYGTYDLTNWSIMKDWPWFLSMADWAWGTALTAVTSAAGFYIARWIGV